MRVAQWILGTPKMARYFGCIGKDKNGDLLEKVASEAGVDVVYQKDDKHPTGKCAVLVTGLDRYVITSVRYHVSRGGRGRNNRRERNLV